MTNNQLINKSLMVLDEVFSRVPIKDPYYTMLRDLQKDLIQHRDKIYWATKLRNEGKTIREVAKEMGYKNPGSISNLLKQNSDHHKDYNYE